MWGGGRIKETARIANDADVKIMGGFLTNEFALPIQKHIRDEFGRRSAFGVNQRSTFGDFPLAGVVIDFDFVFGMFITGIGNPLVIADVHDNGEEVPAFKPIVRKRFRFGEDTWSKTDMVVPDVMNFLVGEIVFQKGL